MANRSNKRKKKEHNFAVNAFRVFQEVVSEDTPPEEGVVAPESGKNPRRRAWTARREEGRSRQGEETHA